MRRDLSEAFSLPLWLDPFHLTPSTSACQAGESPRNIIDQARAHMAMAALEAIVTRSSSDSSVPGWPFTSVHTPGTIDMDLSSHST